MIYKYMQFDKDKITDQYVAMYLDKLHNYTLLTPQYIVYNINKGDVIRYSANQRDLSCACIVMGIEYTGQHIPTIDARGMVVDMICKDTATIQGIVVCGVAHKSTRWTIDPAKYMIFKYVRGGKKYRKTMRDLKKQELEEFEEKTRQSNRDRLVASVMRAIDKDTPNSAPNNRTRMVTLHRSVANALVRADPSIGSHIVAKPIAKPIAKPMAKQRCRRYIEITPASYKPVKHIEQLIDEAGQYIDAHTK